MNHKDVKQVIVAPILRDYLYLKFTPVIIPALYRNRDNLYPVITKYDIKNLENILDDNKIYLYNKQQYSKEDFIKLVNQDYQRYVKRIYFDYYFSYTKSTDERAIQTLIKYFKKKELQNIINVVLKDEKLFDFQRVGIIYFFHKLINRNQKRILIGDDRGLGKSIQSLKIVQLLGKYPVLIICPAYLRYNWLDEIETHLGLGNQVFIINDSTRLQILEHIRKNIYVISYNYFVKEKISDILSKKKFQIVILDEIHYIKNEEAKSTSNILDLISKLNNPYIIGLTGTPIWNKVNDLYTIFDLMYPNLFRNKSNFIDKYCYVSYDKISKGKKSVYMPKITGYKNLKDLGFKLRSIFMIRRIKKEVLDQLPPKIRTKFNIEINEKEIQQLNQEIYNKLTSINQGTIFDFLKNIEKFSKITAIYKIPYTIEFIKNLIEENSQKVVLFFYHREIGETLQQELQKKKINSVLYIGGLNDKERQSRLNQFYNDEKCKVFLGSIRACGLGLNLTNADKCLFIELDYNPTWHLQAEDRLYRIGTKNSVNIYYLVVKDTFDEKLVEYIMSKAEILDETLGEDSNKLNFDQNDFIQYVLKEIKS